jgi:hypothetical protein
MILSEDSEPEYILLVVYIRSDKYELIVTVGVTVELYLLGHSRNPYPNRRAQLQDIFGISRIFFLGNQKYSDHLIREMQYILSLDQPEKGENSYFPRFLYLVYDAML